MRRPDQKPYTNSSSIPPHGPLEFWGLDNIARRMGCSRWHLFEHLYKRHSFFMILLPRSRPKNNLPSQRYSEATWYTNEAMIQNWLLAQHTVQRQRAKKYGRAWWKRAEYGFRRVKG